jgi:hypothetical protein
VRKEIVTPAGRPLSRPDTGTWLDIEQIAQVQVSSEDPAHPIESALISADSPGWRAGAPGRQMIRLIFDRPQRLTRIWLRFAEPDRERTQQFTLRWSADRDRTSQEIVRQQWHFSPAGSTIEIEDYAVDLIDTVQLELTIDPDLSAGDAVATLAEWHVA